MSRQLLGQLPPRFLNLKSEDLRHGGSLTIVVERKVMRDVLDNDVAHKAIEHQAACHNWCDVRELVFCHTSHTAF